MGNITDSVTCQESFPRYLQTARQVRTSGECHLMHYTRIVQPIPNQQRCSTSDASMHDRCIRSPGSAASEFDRKGYHNILPYMQCKVVIRLQQITQNCDRCRNFVTSVWCKHGVLGYFKYPVPRWETTWIKLLTDRSYPDSTSLGK